MVPGHWEIGKRVCVDVCGCVEREKERERECASGAVSEC